MYQKLAFVVLLLALFFCHHCHCQSSSELIEETVEFPHNSISTEELDISAPYLWQMAAFTARQMSNKQTKMKLVTLSGAEKTENTYRLRVTLQRVERNQLQIDRNVSWIFL